MTVLLWLAGLVGLFALASATALYSYGRFAKKARGAPSRAVPPRDGESDLDRLIAPLVQRHAGRTGLAAVFDNGEAFALRALSARHAVRSLDMLYYIWRDDMTGRLMARELIAAADRGVRVRLLLDDINVQGIDPSYRALNGHPGIEVRLFNPIRNRRWALRRGIELVLGLIRFNRRMHCKAWIADGRLGLIGGRNIGNADFGAARRARGRDVDLVVLGAALERATTVFDAYWNSGLALPIAAFWRDPAADLPRFRRALDSESAHPRARAFLDTALSEPCDARRLVPQERLSWTSGARLVADPPEKALGTRRERWMPAAIEPLVSGAQTRLMLVTPYFVPGREGLARLTDLAARGVAVQVLTNSLAASNQLIVHGAYRRYRRPLLAAGVALYEFAPLPGPEHAGTMLHSKILLVDGRRGFVGSFNFDLRSAFLNTEMGVVFDAPELVDALEADVARDTARARSYALSLSGRRLRWSGGGRDGVMTHEPGAPALRRGVSWLIGHLPIHRYL